MVMAGKYADTLRALGRYLDEVDASEVTVIEEGEHLGVVWRGRGLAREARSFGAGQLHALRMTARLHRGLERSAPRYTLAELLRTLGTMVDAVNGSGVIIAETQAGFRLSTRIDGHAITQMVPYHDVLAQAQARFQHRPGTQP
jgi:hypothetical protein